MRISVCVPTYNGERFIGETIRSVLSQSMTDFELIASDDCSDDQTFNVLRTFDDPRVRLSRNSKRLGIVANWNRCLALASNDYVCIFNHDDSMQPHHLAKTLAVLDAYPSCGFVFTDMRLIDESGRVIGGHWSPRELPDRDTLWSGIDFFQLLLQVGNIVPGSSVVMRRALVADLGGFDARLTYTLDLEMWLRMALWADVGYLSAASVHLRRHSDQVTSAFSGTGRDVEQAWQALRIVFSEQQARIPDRECMYRLGLTHLANWARRMAYVALRRGSFRAAVRYASLYLGFRRIRLQGAAALLRSSAAR